MGPISALNNWSPGDFRRPQAPAAPSGGSTHPGAIGDGVYLRSSAVAGRSVGMLTINTQVAQLLQSIGGGVQNNQSLQLMIALLILLALLQQPQRSQRTAADAWIDLLGRGAAGLQRFSGFTSQMTSSTSISFEQTSIAVELTLGSGIIDGPSAGQPGAGSELDISA